MEEKITCSGGLHHIKEQDEKPRGAIDLMGDRGVKTVQSGVTPRGSRAPLFWSGHALSQQHNIFAV